MYKYIILQNIFDNGIIFDMMSDNALVIISIETTNWDFYNFAKIK